MSAYRKMLFVLAKSPRNHSVMVSTLAVFLMLFMGISVAGAKSGTDKKDGQKVIPTLVTVNSKGVVTDVSSGVKLDPKFQGLLEKTVSAMIKKPAMEHGHPISSQMILNMKLVTNKLDNGQYSVRFAYQSSKALPTGSWYWVHTAHGQLRLANRYASSDLSNTQFGQPQEIHQPGYYQRPQPSGR